MDSLSEGPSSGASGMAASGASPALASGSRLYVVVALVLSDDGIASSLIARFVHPLVSTAETIGIATGASSEAMKMLLPQEP